MSVRVREPISSIACRAALEIDNYLTGKQTDFSYVNTLQAIIEEKSGHAIEKLIRNPHFAFWHAMEKTSEKKWVRDAFERKYYFPVDWLGLEMKLFSYELENVPYRPKERLEQVRDFCLEFCREMRRFEPLSYKHYIA